MLLALFGGCYENPEHVKSTSIIDLSPSEAVLEADGVSAAEVSVVLDQEASTSKQLTLTCSAGVVNPTAAAGDAAERTITRNIPPSGRTSFRYVAGRLAGSARLEATSEGQTAVAIYELRVAYPDTLELVPLKYRLLADGADRTQVTLSAFRVKGKPSSGLRASLKACCDANGTPAECSGLTRLHVPPSSLLDSDSAATFDAVTERLTGTSPEVAWIVATVFGSGAPEQQATCAPTSPPEGGVRAELRITLDLLPPPDAGS